MAKTSFLERMKPHAERSKIINWPFAADSTDGGERRVRVKILGGPAIGLASRDARDHFKGKKPTDGELLHRQRAELVHIAFEDLDGLPIASADELHAEPPAVVNALFDAWDDYQSELSVAPLSKEQTRELIDDLKKNTRWDLLRAFPSSWLIGLITTLVAQLASSTQDESHGS